MTLTRRTPGRRRVVKRRLTDPDLEQLAALRYHWGRVFRIEFNGQIWKATAREGNLELGCDTGDGLKAELRRAPGRRP